MALQADDVKTQTVEMGAVQSGLGGIGSKPCGNLDRYAQDLTGRAIEAPARTRSFTAHPVGLEGKPC